MTEYYTVGSIVTFVANGKNEVFELMCDADITMIEDSILEKFEAYREESLCVNGVSVMYPNIKSGYLVVDGSMAERLIDEGKQTYFSIKNMSNIMRLGLRKGDVLHLKGIASFHVSEVDFGDRCLCVELK